MTYPTNDTAIGNLLNMLRRDGFQSYYAAFSALLEERDSLRDEIAAAYRDRASARSVFDRVKAERDALQSKIDSMNEAMHSIARRQVALEEEAEERQSIGLRERLVCAALTGVCADPNMNDPDIARFAGDIADAAVAIADATLAAMRKGDANA